MGIHKEGGNRFDDMRIDIDAAFDALSEWQGGGIAHTEKVRRSVFGCRFRFFKDAVLCKLGIMETIVMVGIRRGWMKEFLSFWCDFLDGRPMNIMDYHFLRMNYRVAFQEVQGIEWGSKKRHADNWKRDKNIFILFNQYYNASIKPVRDISFIKRNSRILEYGCSHAPYYRAYRDYFGYKKCKWVLADLKQASFLYSCFTYKNDEDIERLVVIDESNMDDPLYDIQGQFDAIFLTTVLEHLHEPLIVTKMLINKLKHGGLFVFDYIKSDAQGLDSTEGLTQRQETLEYIRSNVKIIKGDMGNLKDSIGLCIGRKI